MAQDNPFEDPRMANQVVEGPAMAVQVDTDRPTTPTRPRPISTTSILRTGSSKYRLYRERNEPAVKDDQVSPLQQPTRPWGPRSSSLPIPALTNIVNHQRSDSDSSTASSIFVTGASEQDPSGFSPPSKTARQKLAPPSNLRPVSSVNSLRAIGTIGLGGLKIHTVPDVKPIHDMVTHQALTSGAIVLIKDIPAGTIFGCDARSFTIGEKDKFEGIRGLPAGVHFVWAGSSAGSHRSGFWLIVCKKGTDELGDVILKSWSKETEDLVDEISFAEVHNHKSSVPTTVHRLRLYDADTTGYTGNTSNDIIKKFPTIWTDLASRIKVSMLSKVTGQKKWNSWKITSSDECKVEREKPTLVLDVPEDHSDEVLSFVFPKETQTFSQDVVGRERTEQAMDSSQHVCDVMMEICSGQDSDEIIGELQFCYLAGMLLGNAACQEHWGHVVKIVFKAIKLTLDQPVFFHRFIKAVHTQLMFDDVGIDGSIFDFDHYLARDLKLILISFKSKFNELTRIQKELTPDQKTLCATFEEFETFLWKFRDGWDLKGDYLRKGRFPLDDGDSFDAETDEFMAEDERGEFAPAIVELDEDGREKDLICF